MVYYVSAKREIIQIHGSEIDSAVEASLYDTFLCVRVHPLA
jgi:hypothetical protein